MRALVGADEVCSLRFNALLSYLTEVGGMGGLRGTCFERLSYLSAATPPLLQVVQRPSTPDAQTQQVLHCGNVVDFSEFQILPDPIGLQGVGFR